MVNFKYKSQKVVIGRTCNIVSNDIMLSIHRIDKRKIEGKSFNFVSYLVLENIVHEEKICSMSFSGSLDRQLGNWEFLVIKPG